LPDTDIPSSIYLLKVFQYKPDKFYSMENYAVSIVIKWIHLMATVAWIGGMFTNFFVYLPVIGKVLDPPTTGKLMGAAMKRFRVLVYVSMGLFLLTGMLRGFMSEFPSEALWTILFFIKIGVFVIMVILAIYAFEFLAPKVAKIAAKGPSPELLRIQKSQMSMAMFGLFLGIIILALTAAL
jgi:uncharacterized membrane protein